MRVGFLFIVLLLSPQWLQAAPACILKIGASEWKMEVAVTPQEREKGLMFRRYLPHGKGMVFVMPEDRPVSMWMKNTYLPLDMIFVGKDRIVQEIHRDAKPLSETVIASQGKVAYVLEIKTGQKGIAVGDRVDFSDCPAVKGE